MPGPMRIGGSRRPTQTYLKYGNCNTDGTSQKVRYPPMRNALNKTGSIFLSRMGSGEPCHLGVAGGQLLAGPPATSPTTGTSCRSWTNRWGSSSTSLGTPLGNGGMKPSEYEAYFVLWAALKSPLLIGCDLSKMSDDTLRILTNEEVIAVSQDRLGKQAKRLRQEPGPRDYWVGQLSPDKDGNEGWVAVPFNRAQRRRTSRFR
jgi:alpha-galactosidase